ncbi:MAG: type II toxin-antitoxin system RelE/ParE family toxin [Endomicrobium sp.]|jgi:putative addiction module killer protein|nr:type II toxin-antitoxin system RelE/ParE family toxin [Endomicrobium sp.]
MNIITKVLATDAFQIWLENLKDMKAVGVIKARIERIKKGNIGDWKRVEGVKNIFEVRIDVSKGYRLYYTKRENTIIILLCGGVKDTQNKNIKEAEHILKYLE